MGREFAVSQEDLDREDQMDVMYGSDGWVDVTDRIQEFDGGKTFSCDCGQDVGVKHSVGTVTCEACGLVCVDLEFEDRSPPERDEGQQSLLDF